MSQPSLSTEQKEILAQLARSSNEQLEAAGQSSATHAINLGCSIGLGPVIIIILLVFMISKGSWTVGLVTAAMLFLILMVFSSLIAATAKRSTLARTFTREIQPQITRTLNSMDLSQSSFEQFAREALPDGAVLMNFLEQHPSTPATSSDTKFNE